MLEQTPLLVLYNGADAWATGKRVQGFGLGGQAARLGHVDQALSATRWSAAMPAAGLWQDAARPH